MLRLFRRSVEPASAPAEEAPETRPASIGENKRVYAIGDIHGRADLLIDLLRRIDNDDADSIPCPTELILLGDLVDRGPQSRKVVELAMQLSQSSAVHFLKGNHEEIFIRAARGEVAATRFFCRIGGQETLHSYGLSQADYAAMKAEHLTSWMLANIPRAHVDFLDAFSDMVEIGDYIFVHAGIRPGVPLNGQEPHDLRWIRADFLKSSEAFGKVVIHGHTITPAVDEHSNRIGIDTGAYMSGRLTAIGLQADQHWFLSTAD
ncbi:MAG: metallophosphoesterase family protein [Sphingobium sp.]|uniref:metallophosphoesterase family protein n=1 Tax=Sphingobium sp. TaxID=1912891 RepID=UPI0029ABD721|nr:metallophosphoesterase family protein [Sphingobium sp.]MDX3909810.1 metallophosphoesterase family protein [Sphingobium sp.]